MRLRVVWEWPASLHFRRREPICQGNDSRIIRPDREVVKSLYTSSLGTSPDLSS